MNFEHFTEVLKIIGIVTVIASVLMLFYEIYHQHRKHVFGGLSVLFFFGLLLSFSDTISKISTPYGMVELLHKATSDAAAVEAIRKRVEDQSATIDLIAKEATSAESATQEAERQIEVTKEKMKEFDSALQDAKSTLRKVQDNASLVELITEAQNDNRDAFDDLKRIAEDKSNPFSQRAASARRSIFISVASELVLSSPPSWRLGVDPSKLTLEQLQSDYQQGIDMNQPTKLSLVSYIWSRDDFSIDSRREFAVQVASHDRSLKVAITAL